MEERKKEKEEIQRKKLETERKIKELKDKNDSSLESELKKLNIEKQSIEEKEKEILKAEKNAPWNVDTISKEGWSKTVFNKSTPREDRSELTDEELEIRYKEFVDQHQDKVKEYAMLSKFEDAKNYLMQNPELVCEESSNYLTFWCLNLEMDGKHDLMEHISKQVISLHYILELGKQMNMDPKGCVASFFNKIQIANDTYLEAFEDEIKAFRKRIVSRAKQKIDEAIKKYEEEEREKRLGPGGLDPQEVFDSLPESLQKCFESRDTKLLQDTLVQMSPEDAKYHMKRCVDSGLWIPDKKSVLADNENEVQNETE